VNDVAESPGTPRLDAESEQKLRAALAQDFHRPRTPEEWEALGRLLGSGHASEDGARGH
jgi:hypothetical protein